MKKIICLLMLFNVLCSVYAQNNIPDNLRKLIAAAKEDTDRVKLLDILSTHYLRQRHNADSALWYETQGLELSRKIHYVYGEVN